MNRRKFDEDLAQITGKYPSDGDWDTFRALMMSIVALKGSVEVFTEDGGVEILREVDYR